MSSTTDEYTGPTPPPFAPVKKGLAVASLVLGILAILGCLIPILNVVSIILAIIAIVLGAVALVQAKKPGRGGKGLAIAGIILSVLAIIGAIVANVLLGAAVDSVSDSIEEDEAANAEAATQFPGATADDVVGQAGETLTVGDITATTTALTPQTDALDASYLCSTVTYVNNGTEQGTFNTFDWSLQDPDGAARTVGIFGDNNLQSGDLAPGGTVTGDVCFEGAATAPGQYVLLYAGSLFGSERGAWLNTL